MIEKAYAKINIYLDCLYKRDDNYHELESIFIPLELHDTLEISILPKTTPDDFVTCDQFSMKISKYNLVHKTIDIAREKFGFTDHLNVKIHKNIYLQAGLGGGSADAAATLRGIIKLYKLNPSEEEIKEMCEKIGSDVLFQFYNKSAVVRGKGEKLEYFTHNFNYSILLVKPLIGSSTEDVYQEADKLDLKHGNLNRCLEAFKTKDLPELGEAIMNSLYEPATILGPEIKSLYEELQTFDFEVIGMSGSGSTLFAISKNKKALYKASRYFYNKGYQTDITRVLKKDLSRK